MFNIAILKDTLEIHPSSFSLPPADALTASLNKKYSNRILHGVGLCVAVFDLTSVSEGRVRYGGEGGLWYKVTFRMVVFRPFISEVVVASVRASDEEGVRLSLGFFEDIYIPAMYLPQPNAFDHTTRAFFWLPPSDDEEDAPAAPLLDSPLAARMYIEPRDVVRVRVEAEEFFEHEPGPVRHLAEHEQSREGGQRRPLYTVVCSIAEQGLGPVAWWKNNGDGEGDEDEDVQMEG